MYIKEHSEGRVLEEIQRKMAHTHIHTGIIGRRNERYRKLQYVFSLSHSLWFTHTISIGSVIFLHLNIGYILSLITQDAFFQNRISNNGAGIFFYIFFGKKRIRDCGRGLVNILLEIITKSGKKNVQLTSLTPRWNGWEDRERGAVNLKNIRKSIKKIEVDDGKGGLVDGRTREGYRGSNHWILISN